MDIIETQKLLLEVVKEVIDKVNKSISLINMLVNFEQPSFSIRR